MAEHRFWGVLRDGQFIGCVKVKDASREQLINMMVGRELEGGYPRNTAQKGEVVLELKNFTRKGVFENVNLKVHAGEILGMAGLVGAGRSEVMKALVGYDPLDTGEIYLDGQKISIKHPHDAIRHHIVMASEDRKELGLVLCRSIKENVSLQNFDKSSLSGGNQQKVVLAKCLLSDPKVLIMDEPTRGIDVGAKAAIYKIMVGLAEQGIAIIMISSEMPELIGMSDRIIVMSGGKIRGELEGQEAQSQQTIMNLAFGGE